VYIIAADAADAVPAEATARATAATTAVIAPAQVRPISQSDSALSVLSSGVIKNCGLSFIFSSINLLARVKEGPVTYIDIGFPFSSVYIALLFALNPSISTQSPRPFPSE